MGGGGRFRKRFGRGGDQVGVDTQEVGQVGEGVGQVGQACRERGLDVVILSTVLNREEPGQVEQAQVTGLTNSRRQALQ